MSTTDSLFAHYPNLLFGHEQLREGHIPLWNPYFFGGIDFTTSMHHHMLNPANWILALFPKEYALYVLTFIEFVEIGFIGLFSYKTFQFLKDTRIISFASAIVVQLSGFTWFTTSTFIGVELFFLTIVFIYLIISYEIRRPIVNFILMTLLTAGILWIGHVGYIAAFFFPIIVVQLVRHYKKLWTFRGNPNLNFVIACLFGLGMALYRLYPILTNPVEDIIPMRPAITFSSNGYKLLSGLIPAIFGIDLSTSRDFFEKLKMDGHIQFHSLLYFGLPTAFFFFLSLRSRFSRYLSVLSWLTFLLILGSLYIFQPIVDLIFFIIHPFVHGIIARVGIAFLIFTIFYFCMRKLDEKKLSFSERDLRGLLVLGGMTVCFVVTFFLHINLWISPIPLLGTGLTRLAIAFIFLFTVWAGIKFPVELRAIKAFNNWILVVAATTFILFSVNFICWCSHASAPIFFHSGILIWLLSLLLLIRKSKLSRIYTILLGIGALILVYIAIFQNTGGYNYVSQSFDFMYPLMGALAFVVSFLVLWEVFAHYYHGKISHRTFAVALSLFLVGDLIFALKIWNYSGASSPFVKTEAIYPEISSSTRDRFSPVLEDIGNESITYFEEDNIKSYVPDFRNYRVNYPGNYLCYPYFTAFTNAFMNYHVRSIGGVDSTINQSFLDYIKKFTLLRLPFYQRGLVFPGIDHKRIQELFGMKYSFTTPQVVEINANAVSRFSAFSHFLVTDNSDEVGRILTDQEFRVNQTVILDRLPEGFEAEAPTNTEKLEYETLGTDRIILNLNLEKSRIILFNDSFHDGWKATWNGNTLPVMLANGYFMAVCVPPGPGTLEFNFQPHMFYLLVKISLLFSSVLLLLSIYSIITKLLRGRMI